MTIGYRRSQEIPRGNVLNVVSIMLFQVLLMRVDCKSQEGVSAKTFTSNVCILRTHHSSLVAK